jgi:hypothetical protein
MSTPLWVALLALGTIGGLGLALVVWLVHIELRERRRARFLAQLAARYRRELPAAATDASSRKVTVDDLIARIRSEGRPVRLDWDGE